MRGRTLDNSLIILDEAQNTTCFSNENVFDQIRERSKMVVNGDITQIDLKKIRKWPSRSIKNFL